MSWVDRDSSSSSAPGDSPATKIQSRRIYDVRWRLAAEEQIVCPVREGAGLEGLVKLGSPRMDSVATLVSSLSGEREKPLVRFGFPNESVMNIVACPLLQVSSSESPRMVLDGRGISMWSGGHSYSIELGVDRFGPDIPLQRL